MDSVGAIFLSSFLVAFSGAASPGPLTVLTVSETLATGLLASVYIVAGHAVLEAAVTVALAAGLVGMARHPAVTGVVGLVGGAVMLLMSAMMVRDAIKGNPLGPADSAKVPELKARGVRQAGLAIVASLSNPYWFVWWITIGAVFMMAAVPRGPVFIVSFYTGHILADLAWYLLLAAAILWGKRLLTPRILRMVAVVLAVMLGVFGGVFLHHGWTQLHPASVIDQGVGH